MIDIREIAMRHNRNSVYAIHIDWDAIQREVDAAIEAAENTTWQAAIAIIEYKGSVEGPHSQSLTETFARAIEQAKREARIEEATWWHERVESAWADARITVLAAERKRDGK
jgi:hypothetical protein